MKRMQSMISSSSSPLRRYIRPSATLFNNPSSSSSSSLPLLLLQQQRFFGHDYSIRLGRKKRHERETQPYKLKTHKGAAARFMVNGQGNVYYWPANHQHYATRGSKERSSQKKKKFKVRVSPSDLKKVRRALPYENISNHITPTYKERRAKQLQIADAYAMRYEKEQRKLVRVQEGLEVTAKVERRLQSFFAASLPPPLPPVGKHQPSASFSSPSSSSQQQQHQQEQV